LKNNCNLSFNVPKENGYFSNNSVIKDDNLSISKYPSSQETVTINFNQKFRYTGDQTTLLLFLALLLIKNDILQILETTNEGKHFCQYTAQQHINSRLLEFACTLSEFISLHANDLDLELPPNFKFKKSSLFPDKTARLKQFGYGLLHHSEKKSDKNTFFRHANEALSETLDSIRKHEGPLSEKDLPKGPYKPGVVDADIVRQAFIGC